MKTVWPASSKVILKTLLVGLFGGAPFDICHEMGSS